MVLKGLKAIIFPQLLCILITNYTLSLSVSFRHCVLPRREITVLLGMTTPRNYG